MSLRHWVILNGVAAGVLLLIFAAMMWDQPIIADETDFYLAAHDWVNERARIPHTHGYVHSVQLAFALFGDSISNARIPGVVTALLNLLLIPALVYAFFPEEQFRHWIAIVAIWLYALFPTTAQNMMLLDIDNTLLTTVLLGVIWLWRISEAWPLWQRTLTLSGAFAVALWVKLPTPVLLMGSIGLYYLLRFELRRAIETAVAIAGAVGIFAATFALYSSLTGFGVEILGLSAGRLPVTAELLPTVLVRFPQGMGVFVVWLSLAMFALLLWLFVGAARRLWQRTLEPRDMLLIFIAVVMLFYPYAVPPAWGYPRYQAPIIPLIALLAAHALVPAWDALSRPARITAMALGGGMLLYKLLLIGDPFWTLYQVTFETTLMDFSTRITAALGEVVTLTIPLALGLTVMAVLAWQRRWQWSLAILLTLGTMAAGDLISTTAVQVAAEYSVRYRYTYDYSDMRQAIADVERHNSREILAVKEVWFYTGLPGDEIYGYVCPTCTAAPLLDTIAARDIDALVWTTKEANRAPTIMEDTELQTVLSDCFTREQHGVFIVYLKKPSCG